MIEPAAQSPRRRFIASALFELLELPWALRSHKYGVRDEKKGIAPLSRSSLSQIVPLTGKAPVRRHSLSTYFPRLASFPSTHYQGSEQALLD